jgi:hypothetical protein
VELVDPLSEVFDTFGVFGGREEPDSASVAPFGKTLEMGPCRSTFVVGFIEAGVMLDGLD